MFVTHSTHAYHSTHSIILRMRTLCAIIRCHNNPIVITTRLLKSSSKELSSEVGDWTLILFSATVIVDHSAVVLELRQSLAVIFRSVSFIYGNPVDNAEF